MVDTVNSMTRDRIRRRCSAGLCAALLALAAAPSAAPGAAPAEAKLSPRLARLASPALSGASPARQARALGLAPDRLARSGGRLLANVRFRRGALIARDDLHGVGAKVLAASGRYQTVTVAVPPGHLRAVAAVGGVRSVTPVLTPILAACTSPQGSVVSEGDEQLRAREAREGPPARDGSGVTVGILSDSFDQATEAADGSGPVATTAEEDVETADLPGPSSPCANKAAVKLVGEPDEEEEPEDEGRAMAQIVHDLAPGAALSFASAFNGETAFAQNIHGLAEAGAEVIADDVFYPGEPFFQDGPIAVAVREVTEEGVTYLSAAGNDNLIAAGHDIGSWETPKYRDAGGCPPAVEALSGANGFHCLDFDPDEGTVDRTFGIKVEPGATLAVDLQWDEPWEGVETDLDAYLLNATGGLLRQSREENLAEQVPAEYLEWPNTSSTTKTVQLVVNRRVAGEGDPAVKFALVENGGGVEATEYPRSSGGDVVGPTIFGHSGSAAAISTGAVFFADSSEPEEYSSRGPVRHDFGPVEGGGPAAKLPVPEELSKPDVVATDCVRTTFFAEFVEPALFPTGWYFCGTSSAAPHAAAVAALMREAKPTATPEDIREALAAGAASPFDPEYGPCDVGAGLLDAVEAIEEVLTPSGGTAPTCEAPEQEVEPSEARASGDWGSEVPPTTGSGGSTTTPTTSAPPPETIRKKAPRTFFRLRPRKVVRTHDDRAKIVFRFGSNVSGATFVCRIDGGLFRPCPARLVRRFPLGPHVVRVSARDESGDGDRTPASYRFQVERIR